MTEIATAALSPIEVTLAVVDHAAEVQVGAGVKLTPPKDNETDLVFSEQVPEIDHEALLVLLMAVGVVMATVGALTSFKTVPVVVVEFPARSV